MITMKPTAKRFRDVRFEMANFLITPKKLKFNLPLQCSYTPGNFFFRQEPVSGTKIADKNDVAAAIKGRARAMR